MSDNKTIPQVSAALCGTAPGLTLEVEKDKAYKAWLTACGVSHVILNREKK